MLDVVSERRLSAIVAIDLAGYSSSTERDERAAVRAVTALHDLIETKASEHGGRVFNTAGDGFMLEFGTVSGALAAAGDIAAAADPPVRIGVHLGEVSVARGGDLLGHGVNVAARLQALAKPGSVLASDTVRRATQGPEAKRLRPKGVVRLDKMSERVVVYALDIGGVRGGMAPRRSRYWPAVAAAALVAVAGAAIFALPRLGPSELAVAVAPFQAQDKDASSHALSAALQAEITSALADRQLATVSPEKAAEPRHGGARLLVSGGAERLGDALRLRVSLNDLRADRVLWSTTLERPADQGDALGEQAAAKIADIVDIAAQTLGSKAMRAKPVSSDVLAAFLKQADESRGGQQAADEATAVDRRIVAAAPNLADAHANLAIDLAKGGYDIPGPIAAQMDKEARTEAERALALDPHCGDAYIALFLLAPHDDIPAHEAQLLKGLSVQPQNAALSNYLGDLLRNQGRTRDAEAYYRRALRLDPLSPSKTATNIFALAGTGRESEAEALADRGLRLFPGTPSVRRAALYTAILYGTPERALSMLEAVAEIEPRMSASEVSLWRAYIETSRKGRPDPTVLAAVRKASLSGEIDPSMATSALAKAGDVDSAFIVANDAAAHSGTFFYTSDLFEEAAAAMRRDPRFMALAARFNVVAYWKATGRWPDFCADPTLPYDCKAAAAKV